MKYLCILLHIVVGSSFFEQNFKKCCPSFINEESLPSHLELEAKFITEDQSDKDFSGVADHLIRAVKEGSSMFSLREFMDELRLSYENVDYAISLAIIAELASQHDLNVDSLLATIIKQHFSLFESDKHALMENKNISLKLATLAWYGDDKKFWCQHAHFLAEDESYQKRFLSLLTVYKALDILGYWDYGIISRDYEKRKLKQKSFRNLHIPEEFLSILKVYLSVSPANCKDISTVVRTFNQITDVLRVEAFEYPIQDESDFVVMLIEALYNNWKGKLAQEILSTRFQTADIRKVETELLTAAAKLKNLTSVLPLLMRLHLEHAPSNEMPNVVSGGFFQDLPLVELLIRTGNSKVLQENRNDLKSASPSLVYDVAALAARYIFKVIHGTKRARLTNEDFINLIGIIYFAINQNMEKENVAKIFGYVDLSYKGGEAFDFALRTDNVDLFGAMCKYMTGLKGDKKIRYYTDFVDLLYFYIVSNNHLLKKAQEWLKSIDLTTVATIESMMTRPPAKNYGKYLMPKA